MKMDFQVAAVERPSVPKDWTYEKSVEKTKNFVIKWKNISADILMELWIAREKLSKTGRPMEGEKTWADYCKDTGLSKSTVNKWLERFDAETMEIRPPEPAEDDLPEVEDDDFEYEEEEDDFEYEEGKQISSDQYMAVVGPLIKNIRAAYKRLKKTRDHTTPVAFSHFIGNIEEMAQRVESWTPKNMDDCSLCDGTGFIEAPNTKGKKEKMECNNCFQGKVGAYRESSY